MRSEGLSAMCSKKAFEVAYALFRVAGSIRHSSLAAPIERQAAAILERVAEGDYAGARSAVSAAEHFIRLGASLNFISARNHDLLESEIGMLNSAIAELGDSAVIAEPDLSDVFSPQPKTKIPEEKREEYIGQRVAAFADSATMPKDETHESAFADRKGGGEDAYSSSKVGSAIRQSAILGVVRQKEECRMSEIQSAFPDVAERTIRNDLQRLAEQGLIEKVGSSGPSTFYRIPQRGVILT